ncbi:pentapeptide repeat-containing protein [Leptolyngbya sp. 'hensonii']|uniref:pentapeptide repeat-containing protein n=1 Tax=Leptolyngbya sp. 'hensonii' TaxID=1922337 RepID=UPI0009FA317F|nr:pentapeptide repeat-containing protein [Leptolyngbya sp. 'hensonii']
MVRVQKPLLVLLQAVCLLAQEGVAVVWRPSSLLVTALLALGFCVLLGGLNPPSALAVDYNKESLVGVDFSGRVLTDASFTKANMRGSNLSNTDVRGVSFFGANLERTNFQGANLSNATLDTARMVKANLTNAILEGAFAFNTKFDGAIIDGADFTDVELRKDAQMMLCQVAQGRNPTTGRETRKTLYCDE